MNQQKTHAIVLRRVDYGEADRILTVLTSDSGKLSLMAKGVRKVKSKLAGGIELFSTSEISYIPGRGEVGTLVSARLEKHYGHIIEDVNRTMMGYELLKKLHKVTENGPDDLYYDLLVRTFSALDDKSVPLLLLQLWFNAQLLNLAGVGPNLSTDTEGKRLAIDAAYEFDFDATAFYVRMNGAFGSSEIKFLRLLFTNTTPRALANIAGVEELTIKLLPLIQTLTQLHISA